MEFLGCTGQVDGPYEPGILVLQADTTGLRGGSLSVVEPHWTPHRFWRCGEGIWRGWTLSQEHQAHYVDGFSARWGRDKARSRVVEAGLGSGEEVEGEGQFPGNGGGEGQLGCNGEGGTPSVWPEGGKRKERLIPLENPDMALSPGLPVGDGGALLDCWSSHNFPIPLFEPVPCLTSIPHSLVDSQSIELTLGRGI